MASNASIDSNVMKTRKNENIVLQNVNMQLSRARSKDALPHMERLNLGINKYHGAQRIREEGRKESERLNIMERYQKGSRKYDEMQKQNRQLSV